MKNLVTSVTLIVGMFFVPTCSLAAKVINATGFAIITSKLDKSIFRSRAIENALHNIVLEADQNLNSFSLVENGQMKIDQIQASSKIRIKQYNVIEETIRGGRYFVTLNAVVDENSNADNSVSCRKADIEEINLSVRTNLNTNNFPAWVDVNNHWIYEVLQNENFSPNLKIEHTDENHTISKNFYSLFKQADPIVEPLNLYRINASISIEEINRHSLMEKDVILEAYIHTKLSRSGKVLSSLQSNKEFLIHRKIMNNFALGKTRSNWGQTQDKIATFLTDHLYAQIDSLNCMRPKPEIFVREGQAYINFGELDGIKSSDVFVIASDITKKTFLRAVEIKDHETLIKPISSIASIDSIIGKAVELVGGS